VAGGGAQRADAVVLAAGARTRLLAATAGATLHALAYRTQCATLELPEADRVPVLHDTVHGFYARPESATRFLAGDGTELRPFDPDAFNPAADTAFIEATAHRVLVRFAGGDAARYRTGWAGLCVGTPDRRPLLGPAPGVGGLYVMTGDNGFGLMRGLALGDLLAASIAGRADGSATGLAVGRFNGMDPDAFPLAEGFSFGD
jgi:glycine/D-amino acid oxidase-like deaminating enzyme